AVARRTRASGVRLRGTRVSTRVIAHGIALRTAAPRWCDGRSLVAGGRNEAAVRCRGVPTIE
ncbi:MAG TPA: hypothetical protein VFD67_01585, partial [Gemmatimonadaceae bacterium]|nr:hypothetical protein [Gemmatimonadaceae bacterium]